MKTPRHFLRCFLILAAFALSGCVSARYKSADKKTPPPVALNLAAAQPAGEATVNTAIFYRGPGSWKRDAYWDEYVLTFVNRGSGPLVVESAGLTDLRGDSTAPGDKPWLLEKESRTRTKELNRGAKTALVQLGSGLAVMSIGGVLFSASIGATAGAASFAVGLAGAAILPFYVGGVIYRNVSSRRDIEAEFARRRLMLPATLAPGQTVSGSLFFRISPGPQRLVLRGRSGAEPVELTIDLAPLKGLHLKEPAAVEKPPSAASASAVSKP
jgi:hypothetical protein